MYSNRKFTLHNQKKNKLTSKNEKKNENGKNEYRK